MKASRWAKAVMAEERNFSISRPSRPDSCETAASAAASPRAEMRSITASAWVRSILPLRNARRVNSPGSAGRAPAANTARRTSSATTAPP